MGAVSIGLYRGPRASHIRRPGSARAFCGVALALCEYEPGGTLDGRTCRRCRVLFEASVPAPVHDLTPSEVALSKVLAAWVEWQGEDGSEPSGAMAEVGSALFITGLVGSDGGDGLTPTGAALIDRARKAGVL